jgi:molybdate transport system ATP-binding protein
VVPARVTAIDAGGESSAGGAAAATVDVHLAAGGAHLIARITRRSLHELGLAAGHDVHALIKAVSFDERSVGYA